MLFRRPTKCLDALPVSGRVPEPKRNASRVALCVALSAAPFTHALADTVAERLARRGFPSVFQAWSPVENTGEGELDAAARHDLYWRTDAAYGLVWDDPDGDGRATSFTPDSVERARAKRAQLLVRNPDMVLLAQLRVWTGPPGFLPDNDPWWRRVNGERELIYPEFEAYKLDMANPQYQGYLAARARALIDSGVVDGIMIDSWNENDEADARYAILQSVRAAVGEAPILVNANDQRPVRSAPLINGLFLEVGDAADAASWTKYRDLMAWGEASLRSPSFTAFEIMRELATPNDASRTDPADTRRMRATTTLSLVGSDGFALYADPNSLPDQSDHRHDWYPFWDVELGRPAGPAVDLVGGAVRRDYTNGVAVHSPPGGSTAAVEFDRAVRSVNTGEVAVSHPIRAFDGDLFLYVDDGSGSGTGGDAAIGVFAPPARATAGERAVVSVPYETGAAVDLVVSFQDTSDGWRTAGFARTRVAPGASTLRVPVDVAADAPPGTAYAWTAWLVPPGGQWPQRLDSATVDGVTLR